MSSRWGQFSSQKTIIPLQKKSAQQDDIFTRATVEHQAVKNYVEDFHFYLFHVLS